MYVYFGISPTLSKSSLLTGLTKFGFLIWKGIDANHIVNQIIFFHP
jgi:hypothetical protein